MFIHLPQRESSVTVLEGVDVTQTNMSFFRQQLMHIATHILRCTGELSEQYESVGLVDLGLCVYYLCPSLASICV